MSLLDPSRLIFNLRLPNDHRISAANLRSGTCFSKSPFNQVLTTAIDRFLPVSCNSSLNFLVVCLCDLCIKQG
jgi:hypothetical protein